MISARKHKFSLSPVADRRRRSQEIGAGQPVWSKLNCSRCAPPRFLSSQFPARTESVRPAELGRRDCFVGRTSRKRAEMSICTRRRSVCLFACGARVIYLRADGQFPAVRSAPATSSGPAPANTGSSQVTLRASPSARPIRSHRFPRAAADAPHCHWLAAAESQEGNGHRRARGLQNIDD